MSPKPALLLIDAQANLLDPANPVAGAVPLLERLRTLLQRARAAGAPVVFVRNSGGPGDPDLPGTPGWELGASLPVEAFAARAALRAVSEISFAG